MKNFNVKNSILTLLMTAGLTLSLSGFARAGEEGKGGVDSGGDGALILPNGEVKLGDAFLVGRDGTISFHPMLRDYIDMSLSLMRNYGYQGRIEDFTKTLLDVRSISLTAMIPENPICQMEAIQATAGATQAVIACTIDGLTYIRKDLFAGLALRDQAALIIHERLHAFLGTGGNSEETHLAIYRITHGISEGLDTLYRQAHDGDRSRLSPGTVQAMSDFMTGMNQLGLSKRDLTEWEITPQGGALVKRRTPNGNSTVSLASTAFVGVNVVLPIHSTLDEGAEVLNTSFFGTFTLSMSVNSRIANSRILGDSVILLNEASIDRSTLVGRDLIRLANNASAYNSIINSHTGGFLDKRYAGNKSIEMGADSRIAESQLNMSSSVSPAGTVHRFVRIGEKATIVGVRLTKWALMVGNAHKATINHLEPSKLTFTANANIDLSQNPFTECADGRPFYMYNQTEISSAEEVAEKFCIRTRKIVRNHR